MAISGNDLHVKGSGKDLAKIGASIDQKLPATDEFAVEGRLTGSVNAMSLQQTQGSAKRGSLILTVNGGIEELPDLKGINFALKASGKELAEIGPLIGTQLPGLGPFDVSAKLEDSDFSINRLDATYKKTKISGNLKINPGAPPRVATHFLVQGFNLGDFLKETGKSDQVRAIVDIAAHGTSSGDSVSSLMANLDGAFGAVMGPGYLTKYLDLLAVDLARKVIPIWGSQKKAGEINCAVVQFDINKGVATSQAFVFDTQVGILSAEGDTNLGTEQVHFLLDPRPKYFSLFSLSTKLRVSGTLMSPRVRPDQLSVAKKGIKALSALAIGPLGLLAPFIKLGAFKRHPCEIKSLAELGLSAPAKK